MLVRETSAEAILISALINTHDVLQAASFGLTPGHFIGYRDEYNWLLNYRDTYECDPTWDAYLQEYSDFPRRDHEDVRSACDMVYKAHGKRALTTAISDAMELLSMGDLTVAYETLMKAEPVRTNPKPRRLLTDLGFLDNWDEEQHCIDTPYPTLNRLTGGMKAGQIWYLAARPKNGKSAHLVNIAKKAVLDGCRVKFYSLEMSEAEVRARFHAALAHHYHYKGITLTAIRDRTVDRHAYKTFVGELQEKLENSGGCLDIHSPRQGMVTPGLVAGPADEYHLNVVDYIGLMRSDMGTRAVDDWRNLAGISNDLKAIAGAKETVFLVASQINREGDHGKEPPKLANLAGSDALGQDGDVILTMRALPHHVGSYFSIDGNRHGPSGKFITEFDPNVGAYMEISADRAEELQLIAEERA